MGRWTKERHAQEAAKKAEKAAKAAEAGTPVETESIEPPTGEPVAPRGNPRNDAMEQLIASRNPEPEASPEPTPEAAPEPVASDAKIEPDPQPEAPKFVTVKVDGEEFEVSQDEIDEAGGVRAYQTARAAENRLKKSNEALAEAKKLQAALVQMAQQQAHPPKPEVSNDDFIKSKMEAIRFGTPEEGTAALSEILQRAIPKGPDPNQIMTNAVVHIARQNATAKFKEEFADVSSNPLLLKLASVIENERLAQIGKEQRNPAQLDWNDFYRRIGNEVRSVVGRQSQPTTTPETKGNPSPASVKEERKASIVNLPTAAARAELPKEEKEPTREDILAEMRKKRPA